MACSREHDVNDEHHTNKMSKNKLIYIHKMHSLGDTYLHEVFYVNGSAAFDKNYANKFQVYSR